MRLVIQPLPVEVVIFETDVAVMIEVGVAMAKQIQSVCAWSDLLALHHTYIHL